MYNWQQKDWPNFTYNLSAIENSLFLFAEKTAHISGIMKALPEDAQMEAVVEIMVAEAIKTSEIEGEYFSRKDVMSSIRNNLGLNKINDPVLDKKAEGVGELIIAVRNTWRDAITEEQLFAWHKMLMVTNVKIKVGQWRDHLEPMQIVSGAMGKEKVHFEAPPSNRVPHEMERFIAWFNLTGSAGRQEIKKAVVKSAVAHLYFESVHPFEDGNGRIGRAIAEKALSQGIGYPVFLSLSGTIEAHKKDYYNTLEAAQNSNEITPWIEYFAGVTLEAQRAAEEQINFTLKKTRFFDKFRDQFNERQLKVIRRVLEEGPAGFEGGISAGKYVSITRTSKATATRDLQDLLEIGALIPFGESGGRSTKYRVNL
jgi:Fic family protein